MVFKDYLLTANCLQDLLIPQERVHIVLVGHHVHILLHGLIRTRSELMCHTWSQGVVVGIDHVHPIHGLRRHLLGYFARAVRRELLRLACLNL